MKEKVLGTPEQHAELDAEYKQLLDAFPKHHFLVQMDIFRLWREEKEYLSKYGQRYMKVVNIR
jgi:hypothetical protein